MLRFIRENNNISKKYSNYIFSCDPCFKFSYELRASDIPLSVLSTSLNDALSTLSTEFELGNWFCWGKGTPNAFILLLDVGGGKSSLFLLFILSISSRDRSPWLSSSIFGWMPTTIGFEFKRTAGVCDWLGLFWWCWLITGLGTGIDLGGFDGRIGTCPLFWCWGERSGCCCCSTSTLVFGGDATLEYFSFGVKLDQSDFRFVSAISEYMFPVAGAEI